jgi:hypothetical protein
MSAIGAATAPARPRRAPAPVPAQRTPAARLTVVPAQPMAAGRLPFAVLVGAILLTGLMGLLLVHTLAAQESFRVHDLTQRLAVLQDQEQQLAVANQQASTPTALRIEAEDLGMRPSTISDYRTAKDGRVIGTLTAIPVAAPAPIVTPSKTTAKGHRHGAAGNAGTAKATTKSTTSTTSTKAAKATKATKAGTTSSGHKAHHSAGHTGASAH